MRTRDAFDRTTARLLAQRVKKKFTNPEEDIANVRVMANGVAATGGQVYNADVAGHRPGTVVKAVNVGSKAKAHYVAQYGSGGLTEADVERMIKKALKDFGRVPDFAQPSSELTLADMIRGTAGAYTNADTDTITIDIPAATVNGDLIVVFFGHTSNESSGTPPTYGAYIPDANGFTTFASDGWQGDPYAVSPACGGQYFECMYKVASSESSTYTFTANASVTSVAFVLVLNGTYIGLPEDEMLTVYDHESATRGSTVSLSAYTATDLAEPVFFVVCSEGTTGFAHDSGVYELFDASVTGPVEAISFTAGIVLSTSTPVAFSATLGSAKFWTAAAFGIRRA